MGVNEDGRPGKAVEENDTGCLSSDAGKGHELFHGFGDNPLVSGGESLGELPYMLGLPAEKAGGAEKCFELGKAGFCQCGRGGKSCKELGGDTIDRQVGGLGGEDRGDEELEGVVERELGPGIRDRPLQSGEDVFEAVFFLCQGFVLQCPSSQGCFSGEDWQSSTMVRTHSAWLQVRGEAERTSSVRG